MMPRMTDDRVYDRVVFFFSEVIRDATATHRLNRFARESPPIQRRRDSSLFTEFFATRSPSQPSIRALARRDKDKSSRKIPTVNDAANNGDKIMPRE